MNNRQKKEADQLNYLLKKSHRLVDKDNTLPKGVRDTGELSFEKDVAFKARISVLSLP